MKKNSFLSGVSITHTYLMLLKKRVEERAGFPLSTPYYYELLSEKIQESGVGYISASTLKRIWGYVSDTAGHHTSTLDILARFAGYSGGSREFFECCEKEREAESDFKQGRILKVSGLHEGACIQLEWMPDRRMKIRYLGRDTFAVEEAMNTKLSEGATVRCLNIMEGSPLLMEVVDEEGRSGHIYEAGRINGVTWRLI